MLRIFDRVVAVATIHSELPDMHGMTVGHRLLGRITDSLSVGVSDPDGHRHHIQGAQTHDHSKDTPDLIRPLREDKFLFFQCSAQ